VKDNFYRELQRHSINYLTPYAQSVGNLLVILCGEDIFKPTTGNKSLHEMYNDNGLRVVNFAISKNLNTKGTMFPEYNRHFVMERIDHIDHTDTDMRRN
jgi:hypothetical protein